MDKTLFKILRVFNGLTQWEVAELVGVTQSTIAKYEIGMLSIPLEIELKIMGISFASGLTKKDINVLQKLLEVSREQMGE